MIVRGLVDARAVLEAAAGRRVLLLSPPEAARLLGPGWWVAMLGEARAANRGGIGVLDCGALAGLAQEALAAGARGIVFSGPAGQAGRLRAIADGEGVLFLPRPPPALDLAAYGALRRLPAWLAAPG